MSKPYTIQRRGGRYVLVYPDPAIRTGKRKTYLRSKDRQSAEAEARRVWSGSGQGEWTVGRIMIAYLNDREIEGIASLTRRKDAWKAMEPFWGNIDPNLIDTAMCKKYAATRPVAAWTLRTELGMLSTALRFANDSEQGYIASVPKIWRPAKPERITRHLSVSDFRKLIAEAHAPHAQLYMQIGVFTMARPAAIMELQWSQVDFERGLIDFNPPGRAQTIKTRPIVPMNRTLREVLELAEHISQSEYVIEHGAQPIKSIKKAFAGASARSGIKATPYTLRHTGAVWAAEKGVPMSQLAQFMGHEDSRTTERFYARYSPDYLRGVADAIDFDIAPVAARNRKLNG